MCCISSVGSKKWPRNNLRGLKYFCGGGGGYLHTRAARTFCPRCYCLPTLQGAFLRWSVTSLCINGRHSLTTSQRGWLVSGDALLWNTLGGHQRSVGSCIERILNLKQYAHFNAACCTCKYCNIFNISTNTLLVINLSTKHCKQSELSCFYAYTVQRPRHMCRVLHSAPYMYIA